MRKLAFLLLIAVIPMFAYGQASVTSAIYGSGAPSSGLCTTNLEKLLYIDSAAGTIYFCNSSGSWVTGLSNHPGSKPTESG
jgi:hypothetical protein